MAAEPVDRRSQGDRDRPRDPASRMADWNAAVPIAGSRLWEVRSKLANNRIARLIFFVAEGRIGILHGFIKKTQKTPPAETALAQKRMKEMMK